MNSSLRNLGPAFIVCLGAACGTPDATPITLRFRGVVGDKDFACGQSYAGLGTTSTQMTPGDFRFYLSRVRLYDASGAEFPLTLDQDQIWQLGDVALLDFEDKTGPCDHGTVPVNKTIRATAPAGTYTGVRFDLGLPFAMDHQDASVAASPLNVSTMFWSWQAGYKFLRTEGATTGQPDGYNVHIGSTACTRGAANMITGCTHENRARIDLSPFDPGTGVIVADLAQLFTGANLDFNTPNTAPGCMSDADDPDCAPIFHNIGLPFGQETAPPGTQRFFRVQ